MKLKKGVKRFLILLSIVMIVIAGLVTYKLVTKGETVQKVKVLKV